MCEQRGSLKLLSHLVSKGEELLEFEVVHRWPKETPLLVYAGSDDQVCNHESSEDFVDKCLADDKHFQIFPVSLAYYADVLAEQLRGCDTSCTTSSSLRLAKWPSW